ncbi:MAG: ABC transporter permease [Tannerellaceae bacterium]|nr:ABC transporter permease [Tannerellaceae bacterium]
MKKEIGRIFVDVAKLVIGGVILAGLMRQDIPPVYLFTVGSIVAVLLTVAGIILLSWEEESTNN